jgi:hypothetical protein
MYLITYHVNLLLSNGLLKHISEVMREILIPRQHVYKCFHYNGWVKIVHTDQKMTTTKNE